MILTEATGRVHMSPALVYNEGFSSCTYLVHHPCSVTPGNSCFSSHHCPFPPLWYHESCIKDVGQIHLIVHTHVHLPGGLVIGVWSCHFSGPRPTLPATSKTKFLTYIKEFICQRIYLSSPESIKLLVFIHRLLIQDQKYSI